MDKKSTKKTVTPNPYKPTAIANPTEIDKGMLEVVQAVNNLMPVAQVKTVQDANYLIERAKAVEGRFSLAVCKLYNRVKKEELFKKQGFSNFAKWAEEMHGDKKSTAYSYARVGAYVNEDGNGTTLPRPDQKQDYHYGALVIMVDAFVTFDKKTGEVIDDEMLMFATENGLITPYIASNREELKTAIRKVKKRFELGDEVEEDEEVTDSEVTDSEVTDSEVTDSEVEKNFEMSFSRSEWATLVNILNEVQHENAKAFAKAITKAIKAFDKKNA